MTPFRAHLLGAYGGGARGLDGAGQCPLGASGLDVEVEGGEVGLRGAPHGGGENERGPELGVGGGGGDVGQRGLDEELCLPGLGAAVAM